MTYLESELLLKVVTESLFSRVTIYILRSSEKKIRYTAIIIELN